MPWASQEVNGSFHASFDVILPSVAPKHGKTNGSSEQSTT
jgi:hypothetical protein